MKLSEILTKIEYSLIGDDSEIVDITFDSRKATKGSLFVCLRGFKSDGHSYAKSAYKNGCRSFLVEERLELGADATQAVCENTRASLAIAASEFYYHPEKNLHIIGITGTKGKTTTAWLVYSILNSVGKKCGYIGSNGVAYDNKRFETSNTTPENLILYSFFRDMVDCGVEYVVLEVSSQALAHNRVSNVPFEITAYTNLYEDHIGEGEHPDFDDYMASKRRLFTDFDSRVVVANSDDEYTPYMTDTCKEKRVTYAINSTADFKADNLEKFKDSEYLGVSFDLASNNIIKKIKLNSPGYFSVYNGLCAISICNQFNVSIEDCSNALTTITVDGRFEIVKGLPNRTNIVDYSHNGIALKNALTTLREYSPNRLICVFGSVGGRTRGRRKELAEVSSKLADYSIITTDNPDDEDPTGIVMDIASYMLEGSKYECIVDREEAIKTVVNMSQDGDIILFAGKGHESYQYINGKKVPFSEKELIIKYSRR